MAPVSLDISLLSYLVGEECDSYLEDLRQSHSEVAICQAIIEAVDQDIISPHTFSTVFPASKRGSQHLDVISLCIRDGRSHSLLNQSFVLFGKALAHPENWELAWKAVGGTQGLLDIFAKISVKEVKALVKAIGACNRGRQKSAAREKAIDELLYALLPSYYPGSKLKSHDKRPIQDHYVYMVHACSSQFVFELFSSKDHTNPIYQRVQIKRLIKNHAEIIRDFAFESVFGDGGRDDRVHSYFHVFIYNSTPSTSKLNRASSSMVFAKKVLELRLKDIDNNSRWPASLSETTVFFSLLKRYLKRKFEETERHSIIKLGLQLLVAKPSLWSGFARNNFWSKLISRWRRQPKLYEDLITIALRFNFGVSKKTIGENWLRTSREVKADPELRWQLLRLYCLHVPENGIDINTATDFKPLADQPWPCDMFYDLTKDQSVRLLKSLYAANPNYSFLVGPSIASILTTQNISSQQNFNVILLLTLLQSDFEESQISAKRAVDELRKKASTARDQPQRAQFAKAAAAYAIASGSLELYAEVVEWQERFVRDALTIKTIFGQGAVMTKEGINLLSGIPQPISEDISLDEITLRVNKGNSIIIKFHELLHLAQREPSFATHVWNDVRGLFGSVIAQRLVHAKDLPKLLQVSPVDVSNRIWGGTLAMIDKLDAVSLNQNYGHIKSVLDTFFPAALASATKDLLDIGIERRKKKDRQPEDDILERLSYEVLLKLANSGNPELAQPLILQTILDRPDASGWHRQFLSISFMQRLCAKDAHNMLLTFAAAIGEKLEEQSYVRVGDKPAPSLVKVTTVKYLAQLLDHPKFMPADAAVEVLIELFKAGTHRDIRLATLASLLSSLDDMCSGEDNWRANPLFEKIMGAFETIIPIAGSINESRPLRPEDWVVAEEKLQEKLPEVSETTSGLPPLLAAILRVATGRNGLEKLQSEFMTRIILPVLNHSQTDHRKWVALFLKKHKANFTVDDLPPSPISSRIWHNLVIYYPELVPEAVLEDWNKYLLMSLTPPEALTTFNTGLKELVPANFPELSHWFSLYNKQMGTYVVTSSLLGLIQREWAEPPKISLTRVLEMVLEHGSLYLDDYEQRQDVWNACINSLHHPTKSDYPAENADAIRAKVETWEKRGRHVIEKFIALITEKKAEHARAGKRSILPSTTKLQLWLLPYPCFPDAAVLDEQCEGFATDLEEVLGFHLQGSSALHWPRLVEEASVISKLLNTDEERLRVGLYLGDLEPSKDETATALNFVKLTLAMHLVEHSQGAFKTPQREETELLRQLRERVKEWYSSPDEETRYKVGEWKRAQKSLWTEIMGDK